MGLGDLIYGVYGRRIERNLDRSPHPASRGRRTRRQPALGEGVRRAEVERLAGGRREGRPSFSAGVEEVDVKVVTLFLLSTDNLSRPDEELTPLLGIIESLVGDLAATGRWRVHPVGALDLLPDRTAAALKEADDTTRAVDGMHVNVAVGYGGRREIADAVRSLLQEHASRGTSIEELAEVLDVEHIAEHLYTKGQPDPDLVIRTSGEQRLSGFLLWQSAHSEFYFCEALWPDFRRVDFLRALRSYGERKRRFGR